MFFPVSHDWKAQNENMQLCNVKHSRLMLAAKLFLGDSKEFENASYLHKEAAQFVQEVINISIRTSTTKLLTANFVPVLNIHLFVPVFCAAAGHLSQLCELFFKLIWCVMWRSKYIYFLLGLKMCIET